MTTITIPKKLIREKELILIPLREYENLLKNKKKETKKGIIVKRSASFRVPKKHEKFYEELDKELTKILRECDEGKTYGPFSTVEDGRKFLESRRRALKK